MNLSIWDIESVHQVKVHSPHEILCEEIFCHESTIYDFGRSVVCFLLKETSPSFSGSILWKTSSKKTLSSYYIPHHCILKLNSLTVKLLVVVMYCNLPIMTICNVLFFMFFSTSSLRINEERSSHIALTVCLYVFGLDWPTSLLVRFPHR